MPLPLIPLAAAGAAALAAFAVRRAIRPVRIDQRGEDALDDIDEGLAASHVAPREQTSATARWRRVIRFPDGSALELDAAMLARLRVRRV